MHLPIKGFTLIELLIVISIITLMSGMAIPSFSSYIRGQTVKQAREQVKSDLRSLQTNALGDATVFNASGVAVTNPIDWGVLFVSSSPYYYYFVTTNPSRTMALCNAMTSPSARYTLPSPVVFGTDTCLFFSFQDSNTRWVGDNKIHMTNGTDNDCLILNSAGLIKVETVCP